jgi:TetR/AcrR family transcriptional regulator
MANAAASRREQRRVQHHDLSRTQLLDAAEEIFGTKGYHDATLKEVAELAEFSVGSVYSFFENKDDLFLHVFLRRGEDFVAGIRELVAVEHPPLDQLRRLVEFEVEFFRSHPNFGRLYLRTASLARPLPGSGDAGVETFTEVMALQTDVLAAGQRSRAIRAGDPAALLGILSGIVLAYIAIPSPTRCRPATPSRPSTPSGTWPRPTATTTPCGAIRPTARPPGGGARSLRRRSSVATR